jgi:hypothetical protein
MRVRLGRKPGVLVLLAGMIGVGALVVRAQEKLPAEGAAQVVARWDLMKETWKYAPCRQINEGDQIGFTWVKGAQRADFDDSAWKVIDHLPNGQGAAETMQPGVSCGWFRKVVEIPTKVADTDVTGTRPVLIYTIDDYQETWIDGKKNIGRDFFTPWEIRGFNKPTVIDLSAAPYNLKPGSRFTLAIMGLNGPLADPYGGYWFRNCTIEFRR